MFQSGSQENDDGEYFNSLHCFIYSIATIELVKGKSVRLVLSPPPKKNKVHTKQMWPMSVCLRTTNIFTVNYEKYRKSYYCPIKSCSFIKPIKKINHLTTVHGILDARKEES